MLLDQMHQEFLLAHRSELAPLTGEEVALGVGVARGHVHFECGRLYGRVVAVGTAVRTPTRVAHSMPAQRVMVGGAELAEVAAERFSDNLDI